jgi:hypothetical protein
LFDGLFVGAGASVLAALGVYRYMVEADPSLIDTPNILRDANERTVLGESADTEEKATPLLSDATDVMDNSALLVSEEATESKAKNAFDKFKPETLNKRLLYTIVFGSMMDQLGSAGPAIMFQIVFYTEYYVDFLFAGVEPVISATEFRWIETMVLVTFFVTVGLSTPMQKQFGPAGTCVGANLVTAAFCGTLYWMATGPAPSDSWLVGFVFTFYSSNALTTLSLITTIPMIDAIAPKADKLEAQALNQMGCPPRFPPRAPGYYWALLFLLSFSFFSSVLPGRA